MPSVALVPAIAFLAGTWVGVTSCVSAGALWPALCWCASLIAFIARRATITIVAIAAGFALAGAALGEHAAERALDPPIRALLDREIGEFALSSPGPPAPHAPIRIRARLLEDAIATEDGVSVRIVLREVALRGTTRALDDRLRLAVGGDSVASLADRWRAGRTIEVPVTFRRPARYLNDGVPDFERALALDGIALNASAKSGLLVRVVEPGSRLAEAAGDVRAAVRSRVRRWIGRRDPLAGAIVTAILVGDRTGLPDEIRARLQAAGTYHVIAISGGNIAILAALIAVAFTVTGVGGQASAAAAMAGLLAYAAVVNAGPSVWRATMTAVAYLSARLIDHRSPPWNAMAVSAMGLVWAEPLDVRDVGFALTFGATAAIVETARRLRPGRAGLAAWLWASAAASAAVETALLPVSATVFSRVTFAGVVLNLVAVPLMTIAQVAGLTACAAGRVQWMAAPAGAVAAAAARGLVESARLIEIAPWLTVRVPAPAPVVAIGYYLCLVLALWLPRRVRIRAVVATLASISTRIFSATPQRLPTAVFGVTVQRMSRAIAARVVAQPFRAAISSTTVGPRVSAAVVELVAPRSSVANAFRAAAMLCALAILTGATPAVRSAPPHGRLQLTMFDVGQGDALLLQSPGGRALMIDTGGVGFGGTAFDLGGRVLAPALWARGVRALDVLAVTHGDPDHIGGAVAVLRDFRPAEVWEGIPVPGHVPLQQLHAAAVAAGSRIEHRHAGARVDFDGVAIHILHPTAPDWERQRVRNDDSLVAEVRYGEVSLLLTGDASAAVERAILPQLAPARVRLLKVGHHGSRTSTFQELLDRWKPQIAIISCGRGNRFGHPAPEVLARLQAAGARVYRTDRDGEITVSTDAHAADVRTFRR